MSYVLLLIGFALLIKGADYFVQGASNVATNLRVSPLLIGLTIVAFGTSAPEATVSIVAAFQGNAGVAIGNVIGSNIFNITLVVGLTAFIFPLLVESETVRKEIPFALLGSIVLLVVIADSTLQGVNASLITRGDGLILLLFFVVFLYYIFEVARKNRAAIPALDASHNPAWTKNTLLTVGGLVGIILGGEFVVRGATSIALSLGMSETLVGLTIVAIGTSLPELITSVTAALKKKAEIALGNIVGSNIFNIFFVLGAAATVAPLPVDPRIYIDAILTIGLTVLLFIFSRTNYRIGKREGVTLAVAYVIYMIYILLRN
ncbi:calcium/sodium antiporter [Paenalkalicoccus suaedae]|uniref:Calcium/sodium antiporter n=1 Tax=Paenalkalicoccus suaedae TaxID=2592382 RepID=A0A859FBC4_9BACI|nr:calcium/sodium antiporter [Paenalkalicoccus suaedae]QKS69971.1 calcium/sodium antiporter [Paenalkalicoccus suaedae]